jgi:hypothetical protein
MALRLTVHRGPQDAIDARRTAPAAGQPSQHVYIETDGKLLHGSVAFERKIRLSFKRGGRAPRNERFSANPETEQPNAEWRSAPAPCYIPPTRATMLPFTKRTHEWRSLNPRQKQKQNPAL